MKYRKIKPIFVLLLVLFFSNIGWCGKIIYPWNATTEIVKAGESFTIWFDADEGQNVTNVALRGPYHTVDVSMAEPVTGKWKYGGLNGNAYNRQITVTVQANTPADRYDLILNTSSGQEISLRSVKVVKEYKNEYTIFHISDTHIGDESYREPNGVPRRLRWLSALVDISNIIGPELVFITGDNVNSRSWDEGNADYLTTWPSTRERVDFFYKGSHDNGFKGVHDFTAAAFSVNGNHDYYERPEEGKETKNKTEFWNKYHGLRTPHFTYGDTRFMAFSDAFGEDMNIQAARHSSWLNQVGTGNLRVIYKHIYKPIPQPWATDNNIQLGLCGHNHHKGGENPFTQGSTDMYIANFTEYTTFNLFRVDSAGNYTVDNNLVAVENPKDDPSKFRSKLTLEYAKANDGASFNNSATIVNKFNIGFSEARVHFVMPKGVYYTISKGSVEQQFDGDSVTVVDVRVSVKANSTTSININKTNVPKPTLSGVPYGEHERHILDFWKADSNTPTPLVFVIHGGGWQGGSKERINRFVDVEQLLAAGISVAAINYRYVWQASGAGIEPPVKAPLHDAARALQFVRSKASEWNIDKTHIGATGGSAGACSSLWLAFHDDLADPASSDPISRESTRLQCAAVIGAQTTLDPKQMKEWTPNSKYGGHAFGKRNFQEFLSDRESILPWIAEYSPYALVTADDPPVCLIYKTAPALGQKQKDPTHTSNFGVKLEENCNSIGVDCEFIYASGVKESITATEYLIKKLKAQSK